MQNIWKDTAVGEGPLGVAANGDLRLIFLKKFVQEEYARYQEIKLRSRKQSIDELPQK